MFSRGGTRNIPTVPPFPYLPFSRKIRFFFFYSIKNCLQEKAHRAYFLSTAAPRNARHDQNITSSGAVTELWNRAAGATRLSLTIPFGRWSLNIQFHIYALNYQPPPDEDGQSPQRAIKSFLCSRTLTYPPQTRPFFCGSHQNHNSFHPLTQNTGKDRKCHTTAKFTLAEEETGIFI